MSVEELKRFMLEYDSIKYSQSDENRQRRDEIEEQLKRIGLGISTDEFGFVNVIVR